MAAEDYTTEATRLSSFEVVVKFSRKTVKWPREAPSPAELSSAGFFWKPSASSYDNTQCFLCERALDNWEKDDSPLAEHLKHSPDCGWAIVKDLSQNGSDPAVMEDPTGTRLSEARRATFMERWPHEHKRGWLCKTERLVQAGWFYAPTPESDDYVSCAYCKLSLDGFEPKDDPFDEHHRRSPACPFFNFAGTTAPKAARGKKARASKASRLSTQSTMTSASEVTSIPDLDESIDASTLSLNTVASSVSGVSNKNGSKHKGRASKIQEIESVEIESRVVQEGTAQIAAKGPRGRKRSSDLISDDDRGNRESTVKPDPPAKRRHTRTRGTVVEQVAYPLLQGEPASMTIEVVLPKPTRGGKKRASSRTRTNLAASPASLRAAIPDIAALEAELEADLDRPVSDEDKPTVVVDHPKKRARKPKGTATSTTVARGNRATAVEQEHLESDAKAQSLENSDIHLTYDTEIEGSTQTKLKATKKRASKKNPTNRNTRNNRGSAESIATSATGLETQLDSSIITPRTEADDSGHETDTSVRNKSIVRKASKRKATNKGRGKKGGIGLTSKNIEDIVQLQSQNETLPAVLAAPEVKPNQAAPFQKDVEGMDVDNAAIPTAPNCETSMSDEQAQKQPTRTATKVAKVKSTKAKKPKAENKPPHLSMPGAFSPLIPVEEHDIEPSFASVLSPTSPPVLAGSISNSHAGASLRVTSPSMPMIPPQLPPRSPLRETASTARPTPTSQRNNIPRVQRETTPSPSPQSSDAENAPPSTRPASTRPPLVPLSPAKNQTAQVVLAPGTPRTIPLSPSKIGGGLRSDIPWTSVDVEMILTTRTPGADKENVDFFGTLGVAKGDLTSPEKKMTVEEWINWNAQKAEERLKAESERIVGVFEKEGSRALRVLEGIEVSD